jgi:hypothetical protein
MNAIDELYTKLVNDLFLGKDAYNPDKPIKPGMYVIYNLVRRKVVIEHNDKIVQNVVLFDSNPLINQELIRRFLRLLRNACV